MAGHSIDIVVAGHICVDITPPFDQAAGVRNAQAVLKPGSLLFVGPPVFTTGGAVSNTGLAIRRLGQSVLLMGKCCDDGFGRILLNYIRNEAPGAEKGMRTVAGEATSYSVIIAPPGMDRTILHCPGTNDTFGLADVNLNLVKWARLFHFGYPTLMKKMYSNRGRELAKIMRTVHEAGVTTSLDTAVPDPNSASGKADWADILKHTLPSVDVFLPSAEELLYMLEPDRFMELRAATGSGEVLDAITVADVVRLGERCLDMGVAVVTIKCGKMGIYARTSGLERIRKMGAGAPRDLSPWSGRELWQPCYKAKKILSTNGAGDNAIAGFLAALLNGTSLEAALRYSVAAGYQNLQVLDAISGVKSWPETTAFIRGKPPVVKPTVDLSGWVHNAVEGHFVGPANRQ